jgi:hypothetical protein
LRDYLFCFGRIDSNIGHFQPLLRARAKLSSWGIRPLIAVT